MKTFGVQELTERINEILRVIEQDGEIVELTDHGKVVAHLVPASNSGRPVEVLGGAVLTDVDRLRAEIAARWHGRSSAVDAVREVRGDQSSGAIWTDFDRLAAELGVDWPKDVNAVNAVRDVRREL